MEQLKKKIGPLPMYVWIGLVVVAGVGFMLWKRSQTNAAAAAAGTSTTAASTLPSTATAGYVMSGDNGGDNYTGYNNNGSPAVTSAPQYALLASAGDVINAMQQGWQIFSMPAPGMYAPFNGTPQSFGPSAATYGGKVPAFLYTSGVAPTAASPITTAPAVAAAATAPVTAVSTPVGSGTGNPATAIAPSALMGPTAPATAPQYVKLTPAEWAANLGNEFQQLSPGVYTKYTGAVSAETSPLYKAA